MKLQETKMVLAAQVSFSRILQTVVLTCSDSILCCNCCSQPWGILFYGEFFSFQQCDNGFLFLF